jgi:hypothetical protein
MFFAAVRKEQYSYYKLSQILSRAALPSYHFALISLLVFLISHETNTTKLKLNKMWTQEEHTTIWRAGEHRAPGKQETC